MSGISLPIRRNATSPRHRQLAHRFAPPTSDTTQADDTQNRLPALSMYDSLFLPYFKELIALVKSVFLLFNIRLPNHHKRLNIPESLSEFVIFCLGDLDGLPNGKLYTKFTYTILALFLILSTVEVERAFVPYVFCVCFHDS